MSEDIIIDQLLASDVEAVEQDKNSTTISSGWRVSHTLSRPEHVVRMIARTSRQPVTGRLILTDESLAMITASTWIDSFKVEAEHTLERVVGQVEHLIGSLSDVREQLAIINERTHRFAVPVNALPRDDLRLRVAPIWVSVEQDEEDSFVAGIVEVGAVGYGDTPSTATEEAILDLCRIFDELADIPEEALGPKPKRWWDSLVQLVERNT